MSLMVKLDIEILEPTMPGTQILSTVAEMMRFEYYLEWSCVTPLEVIDIQCQKVEIHTDSYKN